MTLFSPHVFFMIAITVQIHKHLCATLYLPVAMGTPGIRASPMIAILFHACILHSG